MHACMHQCVLQVKRRNIKGSYKNSDGKKVDIVREDTITHDRVVYSLLDLVRVHFDELRQLGMVEETKVRQALSYIYIYIYICICIYIHMYKLHAYVHIHVRVRTEFVFLKI